MLNLPYPQHELIFRRMVFIVLSRNSDDHTKNFAYLMDRNGKWNLAPAFDLCYNYIPANPWVKHQAMSVNGRRLDITRNDFLAVAKTMSVRKAEETTDQVNDVV